MYSGTHCEITSNELKAIRAVITTSGVIAIIMVCSVYVCTISMDVSRYLCKGSGKLNELGKHGFDKLKKQKGKRKHLHPPHKPVPSEKYVYLDKDPEI
jgi:hypothetical protein